MSGEGEEITPQELAERIYGDKPAALDVAYQLMQLEEQAEQMRKTLADERRRTDLLVRSMAPEPLPENPVRRALVQGGPWIAGLVIGMVTFVVLVVLLNLLAPGWCGACAPPG